VANLLRALRTEIRTAARGESKAALGSLRSELQAIRKSLAGIERRLGSGAAAGLLAMPRGARGAGRADEGRRARFSPALMRRHREALAMSRKAYAKLLSVSGLSVYLWESGRTKPRRETIFAWQDLRKKGARELRAIAGVAAPKRRRRAKESRAKSTKLGKAAGPAKRARGMKKRARRAASARGARRSKAA